MVWCGVMWCGVVKSNEAGHCAHAGVDENNVCVCVCVCVCGGVSCEVIETYRARIMVCGLISIYFVDLLEMIVLSRKTNFGQRFGQHFGQQFGPRFGQQFVFTIRPILEQRHQIFWADNSG